MFITATRATAAQLVTLRAGCHARVHRTRILRRWLPEILVALWRERHPNSVEQLQLPVEMSAAALSGAGWQIFSGFPACIVAGQLLGGRVGRGWQRFSGFLPRSGAVPLRLGNVTRCRRGALSETLTVAITAAPPDWRSVASLAVDAVSSAHSKRAYEKALKDFVAWYSAEARPPFSRAVVQQYRSLLEAAGLAPTSINLRLSAIRKLAAEAAENGLLDRSAAQGMVSLKGVRQSGARAGNWLTREQARDLLAQPDLDTMEGKRDRAILAVLLGCALCAGASSRGWSTGTSSGATAAGCSSTWWARERGSGRCPSLPLSRLRPTPGRRRPAYREGPLFRRVRRRKYPEETPEALSERMIWHMVMKYARKTGLVDKLGPHEDLRQALPRLRRGAGADSVPAGPRVHPDH
jgi:integrase